MRADGRSDDPGGGTSGSAEAAEGWRRSGVARAALLAPLTERMLDLAGIAPGDRVLDVTARDAVTSGSGLARGFALDDDARGEQTLDRVVVVPDLAQDLHGMLAQFRREAWRDLLDTMELERARYGQRRACPRIVSRKSSR